jgi:hypothetical protein
LASWERPADRNEGSEVDPGPDHEAEIEPTSPDAIPLSSLASTLIDAVVDREEVGTALLMAS